MADDKRNSPRKKKASTPESVHVNAHEALMDISNAVVQSLLEHNQDDLEAFELYTHALKAKIHLREKELCSRLIKGYEALLAVLK